MKKTKDTSKGSLGEVRCSSASSNVIGQETKLSAT